MQSSAKSKNRQITSAGADDLHGYYAHSAAQLGLDTGGRESIIYINKRSLAAAIKGENNLVFQHWRTPATPSGSRQLVASAERSGYFFI